ncbi:hypothetical protein [Algoriphagus sp. Y33]|uniref:hypothetical protein n=1 Tax=Algoriphagus sp. Y33 TaxID=2772483 RepID=UPI001CE23236|nr:hypothetical protein [Algoriphagus sp. Y33]
MEVSVEILALERENEGIINCRSMDIQSNQEYQDWLKALKAKVSVASVKAAFGGQQRVNPLLFRPG